MNNSLGKQFSEFLFSKDFDAANQIIKKARSLDYPHSLINSWENALAKLEPGFRHPLDSLVKPNQGNHNIHLKFDQKLKQEFKKDLSEYCEENNINKELEAEIAETIFENIDSKNGTMLLPDLTSNNPVANLLPYSAYQYSIENPDITQAVERGRMLSELHHFLSCGFFDILKGRRYSSICFSYERQKYNGILLYIVDDFEELGKEQISRFQSLQLGKFAGDIWSVKHNSVYTSSGSCLDLEQYLFENISDHHNLCILLPNKLLTGSAAKWIFDIKLKDRTAVFGYSKNNGRFYSTTEFSRINMLSSDMTNGCIIVNSMDVLSIINNVKNHKSAFGCYQNLIIQLHDIGVHFYLKREILSESEDTDALNVSLINNACWSPFFWSIANTNQNKSLLTSIRSDMVHTWSNELSLSGTSDTVSNSKVNLNIDAHKSIVKLNSSSKFLVGVVIPFRDQIHLLVNCVDSLMNKKEEVGFRIYAVNNDSVEKETFNALESLKEKYPDNFICINSPGEFNYSKINNEAVSMVKEEYVLFLNNDILVDSNYAITTLLKTHLFCNSIITGAKLLYPSGKIQHNGLAITLQKHIAVLSPFRGQYTNFNHQLLSNTDLHPWDRTHECSAVTAACMLMRRQDFLNIDGFDEALKVAYNDVDLCFRAKKRYRLQPIVCSTDLKIFHFESESRGLEVSSYKKARLRYERVQLVNRHEQLFSYPDKFIGIDFLNDNINKAVKLNFDLKYIDSSSTLKSDIDTQELMSYSAKIDNNKKYACIFVHYDTDSLIPDDCVYHIKKLSEYCDIFFVSGSEFLPARPQELVKIKPFCKQILIRKNSGHDFGCWSHVIRKNYSELCSYEGVLLANDSNWGPLSDFSDTFLKINKLIGEVDFLGLTSSITPAWHLQSFFVMYSKKVFCNPYFKLHWFNIGIYKSKYEIIMNYEVAWCRQLRRLGFHGISLYGDSSASNPTHLDWEKLLKSNYPYLKKELIRDNPFGIDLSNLPKILSSYGQNWRLQLLDYLERYGHASSAIAKSLRSP